MSSTSGASMTWISSFCAMLGHEYFAEVTDEFIGDDFNLTGLETQVPRYKDALEMILDVEPDSDWDQDLETDLEDSDVDQDADQTGADDAYDADAWCKTQELRRNKFMNALESHAELLYGLIHQRYIISRQGMQQMAEKYDAQHFGCCPRVLCNQTRVLPMGCSNTPGEDSVKLFCPSCHDIYTPPNSRFHFVDGSFFGTTFAYLFLISFPDIRLQATDDPMDLQETYPGYARRETLPGQNERHSSRRHKRATLTNTATGTGQDGPRASSDPSMLNGIQVSHLFPGLGPGRVYEPKIYGFKVSESAKTGPRMKWLRMRPRNMEDLNEYEIYHYEQQKRQLAEKGAGPVGSDEIMDDANDRASQEKKLASLGYRHEETMAVDEQPPDSLGAGQTVPPVQRKKAQMRSRRTPSARSTNKDNEIQR